MTTNTDGSGIHSATAADTSAMPPTVRRVVYAVVATVVSLALYLTAVRGEVMLFDLPAAARMFCL
jgi:hypothetical protein